MSAGVGAAIGGIAGGIGGGIGKNGSQDWSSNISLGNSSNMEQSLAGTKRVRKYTDEQVDQMVGKGGFFDFLNPMAGAARDAYRNQLQNEYTETSNGPGLLEQDYNKIRSMVDSGPGQQDIDSSLKASRSLADMFSEYSKTGGLPSQADINSSETIAGKLFNPQRVALQQSFQDQTTEANRRAALMGRSLNDPILAAKLAQEQTRQNATLEANQGAWAQNFALQQPDRRLNYANQQANILGGLATQAMSNRQALAAMGEGILQRERDWRYNIANKSGTQGSSGGGGVGGAIAGGLAGIGAGASTAGLFGAGGESNQFDNSNPVGFRNYQNMVATRKPGQYGPWGGRGKP